MASLRQVRLGLCSPGQPGPTNPSYSSLRFAQIWAQKNTRDRRGNVFMRLKNRRTDRRHPTCSEGRNIKLPTAQFLRTGSVSSFTLYHFSLRIPLAQGLICNHQIKERRNTTTHKRQVCLLDALDWGQVQMSWVCWKPGTSHTFQNKDHFVH